MNSNERVTNRLRGQTVDRPPNFDIMMAFAAHHINQPLSRYYLDYRVLAEANLAVYEAFQLDILQTISDPYREAADLGLEVDFPEDGLPLRRKALLGEETDLGRIKSVEPARGRRMSDRIAAVGYLCEKAGGKAPVMGWVEGALAVVNVLRGDSALMMDLYDRPDWVKDCLEFMVEIEIAFARAQIQAGADIIGLGDAIASQISPAMYAEFALPYQQRIFSAIHEMGAVARLHICGNTTRILGLMGQSGADIIDLDWMVNLQSAVSLYGERGPAVCGNFDPVRVMLRGTPAEVRETVRNCLAQGNNRSINAAGCEIPDGTPHENLFAQSQALHEF